VNSITKVETYPSGIALIADDVIEFHASRILLLLHLCGSMNKAKQLLRVEGLTKLAKLDFFIRYPEFFRKALLHLKKEEQVAEHKGGVESRMIRYHYGPWDERYYQLLPYLESKGLVTIVKTGNTYSFYLSEKGKSVSTGLIADPDFAELVKNIKAVDKLLSKYTGSQLKDLVYHLFTKEVSDKKYGELI
jgi:hypothetical protein